MLIRSDQTAALHAALLDRANLVLVGHLRRRFPTHLRHSDDELISLVAQARSVAANYGVSREDNVVTFVELSVMYGQDFHERDWARDILSSRLLHGPDKIALLRHLVSQWSLDF